MKVDYRLRAKGVEPLITRISIVLIFWLIRGKETVTSHSDPLLLT
jgi:hypothetical protein